MKILVVTHDANFSGGANRSLFANIKYLKDTYNIEFTVLVPSKRGELNKKLDEISVPWIYAKYFGVISGLRHDGKDWIRRCKVYFGYYIEKIQGKRIARIIKDQNFDIIYTNTRLPMIGANIARLLHIPHVIHVRELGTVQPLWGKWDFKQIYKNSNKIILISEALRTQFVENVPDDKLFVTYNGIQYDSVEYRDNLLNREDVHIIITGRLVPDKAQKEAIRAVAKINKEKLTQYNIKLHIVGSSPKRTHISWYSDELHKLVTELKIEDQVIFEGEVKNMPAMRSKMDMELMCSVAETFGRVTIEAMRAGLFVVGGNTGATVELINDYETGIIYKQGDYIDLADKICDALSDVERFNKIRRNALRFASNNFNVKNNCEDIYTVFRSVIGK